MYQIWRLCQRGCAIQNKRFLRARAVKSFRNKQINQNPPETKDFNKLLLENKDKIKFSSFLDQEKLRLGYFKYYLKNIKEAKRRDEEEFYDKSLPPIPVSLRYCVESDRLLEEPIRSDRTTLTEPVFQLPFAKTTRVEIQQHQNQSNNTNRLNKFNLQEERAEELQKINTEDNTKANSQKCEIKSQSENRNTKSQIDVTNDKSRPEPEEFDRSSIRQWMKNYEYFDDSRLADMEAGEDVEDEGFGWSKQYGTPDPAMGVSHVPCGGCGALLHCSEPAIPGYLPSEIFKGRRDYELKTMECQRCHFLKEYNIALDVTVDPDEYETLLQSIRHVKSLVVLMVDLLDFPCSVWPGIIDIIGTERPIIIAANKVDLIPGDSDGYLKRIKLSLLAEIGKTKLGDANIKHVALISAKTGYGVEDLISAMFKHWLYKGDVFLVGCTNVGKSSLFNALLQSDYCKVSAVDIIKRATVSRWPGTTLNLLKFPINRPSGWKIYQRSRRLQSEAKLMKIEKEIRKGQVQGKGVAKAPSLIGHIGRTFSDPKNYQDVFSEEPEQKPKDMFNQSKWLYDTPGVVHPDQVLSLLSTEELLMTLPKHLIKPQSYYLTKGHSIFIGGLARLDFIECSEAARFTVFCSDGLPITVTKIEDADEVYNKFLGTELLAAPTGSQERLNNWPGLTKGENVLEFEGEGPKLCCGDIVLSSIGWVAVTAKKGSVCKVAAWTPEGRGIHKRSLSLLPHAINLKGKRLRDTPAYMIGNVYSDEH